MANPMSKDDKSRGERVLGRSRMKNSFKQQQPNQTPNATKPTLRGPSLAGAMRRAKEIRFFMNSCTLKARISIAFLSALYKKSFLLCVCMGIRGLSNPYHIGFLQGGEKHLYCPPFSWESSISPSSENHIIWEKKRRRFPRKKLSGRNNCVALLPPVF